MLLLVKMERFRTKQEIGSTMFMIHSFKFDSPSCKCEPQDESKWTKKEEPSYRTVFTCTVCNATWETICPPNVQHGRTYFF